MKIDAILFDLDNTLLNRKKSFDFFMEKLINNHISYTNTNDIHKIKEIIRISDRDGYRDKLEKIKKKDIKLGLITNGLEKVQNAKIEQLGIREFFDVIIISGAVGVHKPNPEIFKMALDSIGVSPQKSLYIGDHLINDVKGSSDVGMKSIWLKGFMDLDQEDYHPREAVDNLLDLEKFIG